MKKKILQHLNSRKKKTRKKEVVRKNVETNTNGGKEYNYICVTNDNLLVPIPVYTVASWIRLFTKRAHIWININYVELHMYMF